MASDLEWKILSNRLTGEIQAQIRDQTFTAVRQTCDAILTDVSRRMHIPGTGRIYVRRGISHQASSPGQAPAAESGDLIASYDIVGPIMTPSGPAGAVGSDSAYAARLEYGGGNIAARPALTPAMQANAVPFEAAVSNALRYIE